MIPVDAAAKLSDMARGREREIYIYSSIYIYTVVYIYIINIYLLNHIPTFFRIKNQTQWKAFFWFSEIPVYFPKKKM